MAVVEVVSERLTSRDLPSTIDYYVIDSSGKVTEGTVAKADVYIDELDVRYFADAETMLYVRQTYGPSIGVMRDRKYAVRPREYRTPKMLLGLVGGEQT